MYTPTKDISVIIPTYNRPLDIVERTIDSIVNLEEIKEAKLSVEILIIDQNFSKLDLKKKYNHHHLGFCENHVDIAKNEPQIDINCNLIHLYGLNPSVTKAKNFGIEHSQGKYFVFFDDDIKVHENCILNYWNILENNPQIAFLGGREIIPYLEARRSSWKNFILQLLYKVSKHTDIEYIANHKYIGRIKPNSLMYWNFDEAYDPLVRIDSVRGCNWALRREILGNNIRFDANFQGSALREETDLCLQIQKEGYSGYYTAHSTVTHYRQLGGCENLNESITSFLSKLSNEAYFQSKHFPKISRLYFFFRILPLIIDFFKISFGASLLLGIKATLNLDNKNKVS